MESKHGAGQRTDGSPETRLHITRTYAVARERVWQAWTDPQALVKWFGPANAEGVEVDEMDVRAGGAYRIRFRTTDGEDHGVSGIYQEVVPNERLVFSWAWQTTPDRVSRVSIRLREVGEGTELDFVHDRFFDESARNNHKRGWTGTFAKLDRFLAG